MEEEEDINPAARKIALQNLKRQVMRKVDAVQDEVLLQSIMELIEDSEGDLMEGEKDPELVEEASEHDRMHPDNKRKPAPIHQPNKNNANDWLEGLGR